MNYITNVPLYKQQISMIDLITHYCIDSLMESNRQLEEENSSLSKRIKEAEQHQESAQQQYIDELNRYKETIKKLKNNVFVL